MILVYATVISNILATIIAIVAERDLWSHKNFRGKIHTTSQELLKYGTPMIFTFLITWLFQSSDRLFIKHYQGYKELGIYSAAFSIIALLNAVQMAFSMFWVPVAYEKYEKDLNSKAFFTKVNKVVAFVMVFISIILVFFKDIIILILGEDYRFASSMIPFLVLMPLMYTVSETTVLGINFKKKSQYHIIITVLTAIVNLIGHILLIPSMGGTGAAISTGFTYVTFFSLRTFFSKKLYENNYNLKKFYLVTTNLMIFCLYATFNPIDMVYVLLGIFNIVVLCFVYKEILVDFFILLKRNGKVLKRYNLKE